jgi:hypothetical protein
LCGYFNFWRCTYEFDFNGVVNNWINSLDFFEGEWFFFLVFDCFLSVRFPVFFLVIVGDFDLDFDKLLLM